MLQSTSFLAVFFLSFFPDVTSNVIKMRDIFAIVAKKRHLDKRKMLGFYDAAFGGFIAA
jgi:hypothetical protein